MAEIKQHPSTLGELVSPELRQALGKRPRPTGIASAFGVPLDEQRSAIRDVLKEVLQEREFLDMFDQRTMQSVEEARKVREDMGVTQSLGPESRMVDVTETEMGQLSNPQPLFDMAREGDIKTEELPSTETRPQAEPEAQPVQDNRTELQRYTEDFAKGYLAEHEGTRAHSSLEGGKDTAAYGVKFSRGLKREDYNSNAEFAAAVALVHKAEVEAQFSDGKWDELPESVQYALVDLKFNTNTIGSSAKKNTTLEMMQNTLEFIGMTTQAGEKASLISLAKRRASNWNKAAADIGAAEIASIKQIPTDSGGTTFEYLDEDDNIVYSVTTSRKPVKLNSKGKATVLTSTREVEL